MNDFLYKDSRSRQRRQSGMSSVVDTFPSATPTRSMQFVQKTPVPMHKSFFFRVENERAYLDELTCFSDPQKELIMEAAEEICQAVILMRTPETGAFLRQFFPKVTESTTLAVPLLFDLSFMQHMGRTATYRNIFVERGCGIFFNPLHVGQLWSLEQFRNTDLGVFHLALCQMLHCLLVCNEGEQYEVPKPGRSFFSSETVMAGASVQDYKRYQPLLDSFLSYVAAQLQRHAGRDFVSLQGHEVFAWALDQQGVDGLMWMLGTSEIKALQGMIDDVWGRSAFWKMFWGEELRYEPASFARCLYNVRDIMHVDLDTFAAWCGVSQAPYLVVPEQGASVVWYIVTSKGHLAACPTVYDKLGRVKKMENIHFEGNGEWGLNRYPESYRDFCRQRVAKYPWG